MGQRLKRWESPRRQGRNDKGKGGTARARQVRKQQQMLRKKLKDSPPEKQSHQSLGREKNPPLFFVWTREEARKISLLVVEKLKD